MPEPVRASRRKYHIIYKTTCLVTNRYYIGMHSTDDLEDGYIGSGQVLWKSIKKYGKEQHICEILEHHPDRERLALREEELVNPDTLKDPLCMNLRTGGTGNYERPHKEETRQKMSETHKRNNADPAWKAERWKNHKALMNLPSNKTACSNAQKEFQNKPEQKALRSRPCTVDGVIIFESVKSLCAALGKGKSGLRSPSFRFVEPEGPVKNVTGILDAWSDPEKKAIRLAKRQETLNKKMKDKDLL